MKILVNSRQMKQCDKNTIERFGVPSLVLMERAALSTAEEIDRYFQVNQGQGTVLSPAKKTGRFFQVSQQQGTALTTVEEPGRQLCKNHRKKLSVLAVCGFGNNGGDGLAIGRLLWQRGYEVTIVMPSESGKLSEETKIQKEILCNYGLEITDSMPEGEFDVVIDALFGIGLTRNLEGAYREYITEMNEKSGLKVAADIPSGIHADTGEVMGVGFRADVTVTFAFAKPGLLLYPGAEYAGKVLVEDIGIDACSFLEAKPNLFAVESKDLMRIPRRKNHSNKGSYGKVLTAAGHKNMAGAAFLSGKASYLTGAGLVRIFTEEQNRVILQELLPEAILTTWEGTEVLEETLSEALFWGTVIAVGPGLGTEKNAGKIIELILKKAKVPVILDADGLNVISDHLKWLKEAAAPVIVTPHLGEMARLTKKSISEIQKNLLQAAQEFAEEYQVICILKDAGTITALPDGRAYINTSGNHGMATAGSGDVLTGILAGLIAQGMAPWEAAFTGVYLHGAAAEKQVQQTGTYGMMARDILDGIKMVLKEKEGISQ